MNKGIFITFEGNDGSGKTTQIMLLLEYLKQKGIDVITLREPGGTDMGEKIRDILLDNRNKGMSPVAEMLLYAASRAQLVSTVIKPELARNKAVICDRFIDSSLAYQGIARGLGTENVWAVNKLAVDDCLPDITFFMDVDADTAMARREAKGEEASLLGVSGTLKAGSPPHQADQCQPKPSGSLCRDPGICGRIFGESQRVKGYGSED